jgi:hypothetical protein
MPRAADAGVRDLSTVPDTGKPAGAENRDPRAGRLVI